MQHPDLAADLYGIRIRQYAGGHCKRPRRRAFHGLLLRDEHALHLSPEDELEERSDISAELYTGHHHLGSHGHHRRGLGKCAQDLGQADCAAHLCPDQFSVHELHCEEVREKQAIAHVYCLHAGTADPAAF